MNNDNALNLDIIKTVSFKSYKALRSGPSYQHYTYFYIWSLKLTADKCLIQGHVTSK